MGFLTGKWAESVLFLRIFGFFHVVQRITAALQNQQVQGDAVVCGDLIKLLEELFGEADCAGDIGVLEFVFNLKHEIILATDFVSILSFFHN